MKIGIITFHWAANYGAVLQAYALQTYLEGLGHSVEIIDYKPGNFDLNVFRMLLHPRSSILVLPSTIASLRKDKTLRAFREKYLHTTRRFYSESELAAAGLKYDVVISGSDQILNPSFTFEGEGKPTSAYYLSWARNSKRIGYSVSFGCTSYPDYALPYAKRWIGNFDKIGVREDSGKDLLEQLGYNGPSSVTPDPTLLLAERLFDAFELQGAAGVEPYTLSYILRKKSTVLGPHRTVVLDETKSPVTMPEWLSLIRNASEMITNSYHGMVMAILFKVPFAVLLETSSDCGMNDRFTTLLSRLGLEDRITDEKGSGEVLEKAVDWEKVHTLLHEYRQSGIEFFDTI